LFESICKTVLAHESGDPGVQFNEKTEGRKSRKTVPLMWHHDEKSGYYSERLETCHMLYNTGHVKNVTIAHSIVLIVQPILSTTSH
jgi:hypothetical protein